MEVLRFFILAFAAGSSLFTLPVSGQFKSGDEFPESDLLPRSDGTRSSEDGFHFIRNPKSVAGINSDREFDYPNGNNQANAQRVFNTNSRRNLRSGNYPSSFHPQRSDGMPQHSRRNRYRNVQNSQGLPIRRSPLLESSDVRPSQEDWEFSPFFPSPPAKRISNPHKRNPSPESNKNPTKTNAFAPSDGSAPIQQPKSLYPFWSSLFPDIYSDRASDSNQQRLSTNSQRRRNRNNRRLNRRKYNCRSDPEIPSDEDLENLPKYINKYTNIPSDSESPKDSPDNPLPTDAPAIQYKNNKPRQFFFNMQPNLGCATKGESTNKDATASPKNLLQTELAESTTPLDKSVTGETCKENEEWWSCIPLFHNTCKNFARAKAHQDSHCESGCFCRNGLVQTSDGQCVEPDDCPDRSDSVSTSLDPLSGDSFYTTLPDETTPGPISDANTHTYVTGENMPGPLSDATTFAPVTEEATEGPISDANTNTQVTDETTPGPISDATTLASATDETTEGFISDANTNSQVTGETTPGPISDATTLAPVTDEITEEPISDATTLAPVTDEITEEPISNANTHTHVTEPIADVTTLAPVTDEITEEPISDANTHTHVTEPIADVTTLAPVTDETTPPRPISDATTPALVTDEITEEPIADVTTLAPVTDEITQESISDANTHTHVTGENIPGPISDVITVAPTADEITQEPILDANTHTHVPGKTIPGPISDANTHTHAAGKTIPGPISDANTHTHVAGKTIPGPISDAIKLARVTD